MDFRDTFIPSQPMDEAEFNEVVAHNAEVIRRQCQRLKDGTPDAASTAEPPLPSTPPPSAPPIPETPRRPTSLLLPRGGALKRACETPDPPGTENGDEKKVNLPSLRSRMGVCRLGAVFLNPSCSKGIHLGLDPWNEFEAYMDIIRVDGHRGTRHYDTGVLDKCGWMACMIANDGGRNSQVNTAEYVGLRHRMVRRYAFHDNEPGSNFIISAKEPSTFYEDPVMLGKKTVNVLLNVLPMLRLQFTHLKDVVRPEALKKFKVLVNLIGSPFAHQAQNRAHNTIESHVELRTRVRNVLQGMDYDMQVFGYELVEACPDVVYDALNELHSVACEACEEDANNKP